MELIYIQTRLKGQGSPELALELIKERKKARKESILHNGFHELSWS